MGFPNGGPKWGSQMGVPNGGLKWGSQIGVPNGVPNGSQMGPKWGPKWGFHMAWGVYNDTQIDDGKWHRIRATRYKKSRQKL
jgi:hypothetical protein